MSKSFNPSFYRWALKLPESEPVRLMHALAREVYRDLGGEAVEEHLAVYAEIVAAWRLGGPDRPPMREALRAMGARERGHARLEKLREQAWLQARAEVFQQLGERIPLPQSPESADREATAEERAMVRQLSQKLRQVSAFTEGIEFGRGFELGQGSGSFSGGSMPEKVPDPLGVSAGKGSGSLGENVPEPVAANLGSADGAEAGRGSGTFSAQTASQKMSQTLASEPDPVEPPTNKQIKTGIRRLISMRADRNAVKALEAEARSGRMSRAEFVRRIETMMGARQSA